MTAGKGQTRTRDNLFLRPSAVAVLSRLSFADRRPPFVVRCHGCGAEMVIEAKPASITGFFGISETFYPCREAPYICSGCREDAEKLHAARKAMVEHFHVCKKRIPAAVPLVSGIEKAPSGSPQSPNWT